MRKRLCLEFKQPMKKGDRKLTREIKKATLSMGADMVGIASIDRFENAPSETHPSTYLPSARAVISVAIKIPHGVCDVWGDYTQEGKTISPYLFYGYGLINLETSRIVRTVAVKLEKMGYRTRIFPPTWMISQYRFFERIIETGEIMADFSHRHTAVAAGLGVFGANGLVLTKENGVRQRLNSIITDAPLVPDPMSEMEIPCGKKCDYKCIRVCPVNAFSEKENMECKIGGRSFKYARIEKLRCCYGIFGLVRGSGARTDVEVPERQIIVLDLFQARESQSPFEKLVFETSHGIITGDFCGKCLHQCPAHLFENPL